MKTFFNSTLFQFISGSAASMIIWPLLDMLCCRLFTNEAFQYSVANHLAAPVILWGGFTLFSKFLSEHLEDRRPVKHVH